MAAGLRRERTPCRLPASGGARTCRWHQHLKNVSMRASTSQQPPSKIMDTQQVMVHGWIRQDGSLEVDEKLNLPPGPVDVTVQPAAARPPRETRLMSCRKSGPRRRWALREGARKKSTPRSTPWATFEEEIRESSDSTKMSAAQGRGTCCSLRTPTSLSMIEQSAGFGPRATAYVNAAKAV